MILSLTSTVRLHSGTLMPVVGLGVYQNYDARTSCLLAFKHIDSAQMYRNENAVGQAVKESGLKREEIFITTKCASRSHGYEKTLAGVDESLSKFGFGKAGPCVLCTSRLALFDLKIPSGVKHLEEIKQAGLEAPTVNQIEVRRVNMCATLLGKEIVEYCEKNDIVVQAYCPIVRGEKWGHPALVELSKKVSHRVEEEWRKAWNQSNGYNSTAGRKRKFSSGGRCKKERIVENAEVFGFELGSEDMGILDALDEGSQGAISWNPVNAA
ncbi:aldo/keto reductase family domain-containing protein [Rhizoctonia solani AG-1 IA]|uniref:Aldo/keto reductase family domain-containing protein n=1 Tax=Thanatephorus cucumeris (strain AG1-IA) TaxID=983506 RepID=L8WHF0_THACA|nr:aldo/keto reductase family domain-containing protein [Rhizoctonia solani AG-1 IA]